jgi:hypothetical protein
MLRVKKQYGGQIIRRKINNRTITLDLTKTDELDYEFYYKNGFKDIFIKTKVIKYKGI